jgi:hypothetical protein
MKFGMSESDRKYFLTDVFCPINQICENTLVTEKSENFNKSKDYQELIELLPTSRAIGKRIAGEIYKKRKGKEVSSGGETE